MLSDRFRWCGEVEWLRLQKFEFGLQKSCRKTILGCRKVAETLHDGVLAVFQQSGWSRTGTASEITGTKNVITSIGIGTSWDVNNELFTLCEAGIARIAESVGNHVIVSVIMSVIVSVM